LRETQSVMRVTRGLRERDMEIERETWRLRETQSVMGVTRGLRERRMGVERDTECYESDTGG
jgi:hypothetical protein